MSFFNMTFAKAFLQCFFIFTQFCRINAKECVPLKSGVNQRDQHIILNEHNRLRQHVANGLEYNQPPANNMHELTWNWEFGKIAQRVANKCDLHPSIISITLRDGYETICQNKLMRQPTQFYFNDPEWLGVINLWYGQVKRFNPAKVSKYIFNVLTNNYVQIIQATATRIGCGYSAYKNGSDTEKVYVCCYDPRLPIGRDPVELYAKGRACSGCKKCSTTYSGLCAPAAAADEKEYSG